MKKLVSFLLLMSLCVQALAQSDSWTVTVNDMDPVRRDRITSTVEAIQARGGASRSILGGMAIAAGTAGASVMVDVATNEIMRLINLPKTQKQEWIKMIDNECTYTDSISSIRGLKDFYTETSRLGALDPSNINFDGISVRGMRNGKEVLYLSCHIDDSRLAHLYQHSKFCLVVDTIAFHPYECHLPNLGANGIHLMPGEETDRDNSFSYDERENLTIGMDLSLYSSWINEAITIQNEVKLGEFSMSVTIPKGTELYTYSRATIDKNRKMIADGIAPAGAQLDTAYVSLNGDCFVVPRSYMPINGNESMWGTGEYNIKIIFSETCRFSQDAEHNDKMKHWHQDYNQLRKMQKKSTSFAGYFRTLWEQNGNTIMKTMIKSSLSKGASDVGLTK